MKDGKPSFFIPQYQTGLMILQRKRQKRKTVTMPNERLDRNRKFYELNKGGMSYAQIAFSEEHNPERLSATRIGKIISSYRKRYIEGGESN